MPRKKKSARKKSFFTKIYAAVLFTAAIVASAIGMEHLKTDLMASLPYAVTAMICLPLSLVLFQKL